MNGPVARTLGWAAALAVVLAFPCYRLFLVIFSQAGTARMLALWGATAAILVVLAAVAAAVSALWRHASPPRATTALHAAFVGLAFANLAAIGLALRFEHPRLAPSLAVAAAVVVVLAVVARFLTLPADARCVLVGTLLALGGAALAVPAVAAPWVAYAIWTTPPRIAASPLPTADVRRRPDAPRRILLISFDSLRQRSLDLNDPHGPTPGFAAVAREATTFEGCRAAGDRTQLSVVTLLTGVRPHEVTPRLGNRSGFVRQGDLTGIAAHLAPAGYQSHFVTMLVNPGMFGVGQEFGSGHRYIYFLNDNDFNTRSPIPVKEAFAWATRKLRPPDDRYTQSVRPHILAAQEAFGKARRHLATRPGPTFLWLHVAVPHVPYFDVPPTDRGAAVRPSKYRRINQYHLNDATAAQMREYEGIYERYVRFLDWEVARFVAELKADGTWDDALVVMTSDHGEQFRADVPVHGYGNVSEDVTRVPLLIKAPHQRTPRRFADVVGTEDIVPTILDQVYVAPPAGFPGRPLLPAPPRAPRTLYTWARYERFVHPDAPDGRIAAYRGRFKYVIDFGTGRETLYDLARDPQAAHDVLARHPDIAAALRADVRRDLAVPGER